MGKKGGKGKEKGGKGASKPASMSDEDWALYNNFENLLQNLRGNCVFNTIFCSISRATAALWLWQHAASARATRQKLVELYIVPHAIAAFKQVESHEKPACVGLLHCLSEIDLARTQMCETKPVPPHPAINCINLFFDTLETDRNSMATEVSVLGCLRNLCEDLDARRMVSKAIRSERLRADGTSTGKREKLGVFLTSLLSPSAMARADACLMLKLLMTKVEGDKEATRSAEELMTLCIKGGAVDTLLTVLQQGCSDCTSASATHGPLALTYAAQCILKMAPVEECKAQLIAQGGVETLVRIIKYDVHPIRERQGRPVTIPMLAKAAAASVLQWLTLPRNYDLQEYQLLLGGQTQAAHCLPFTLGGLEARVAAAAKGTKPSAEDAALLQAAEDGGLVPPAGAPGGSSSVEMPALPERPQTVPAGMQREPPLSAQLRNMQLKEAGPNPVDKEVPQVLSRLQMVVDAGGIEPLMKLCTPPGGLVAPAPDDGKKKKKGKGKKGKAPPLEPGKEDAYQGASGVLRHVSLLEGARAQMRELGGVLAMAHLLNSKVTETRAHAQGTLLSLGMDVDAEPLLETAKVPEYITHLSSPSRRGPLGKDYQMSRFARAQPDPTMRPMTAPAEMVQ